MTQQATLARQEVPCPFWSLVAEDGTSTVWDDLFSDEIALVEALKAIKENGIRSFSQAEPAPSDRVRLLGP
jgi:hypothetical protein